jgi:putative FmdB family regulatory protein
VPTYVFRCDECNNTFERFISFAHLANPPKILCPQCASQRIQRVWTAPLLMTSAERGVARSGASAGCGCGGTCGCS